ESCSLLPRFRTGDCPAAAWLLSWNVRHDPFALASRGKGWRMRSVQRMSVGPVLLILSMILLGSAAPPSGAALADEPKPATVTEKDNDGKVTLTKGQELVVNLEITTGTGYTWQAARSDAKQLEQAGKPKVELKEEKPGAVARQVFRFKALTPGTTTLEMHY